MAVRNGSAKTGASRQHGHRHAYGQRLKAAIPDERIKQVAMHHKSIESQKIYTEPTIADVTASLNRAATALADGIIMPMQTEIDAWLSEENILQRRYKRKECRTNDEA